MAQILALPFVKERQCEVVAKPSNLYPLPLRLFELGQALPCTIFFKGSPGGGPSFQPRGRLFTSVPGRHDPAAWGYFDLAEAGPLLSYLSSRLEEPPAPEDASPLDLAQFLYDMTLVWTQHVYFGEAPSRTPEQVHLAMSLLARLLAVLQTAGHPQDIIQAVRRHDSGVFTHVVNVSVLGLAFARHLGWPEPETMALGLGALLHDIGMASLPREIWAKTEPLTAREQEEIKTHPLLGVHLLESFGELPEEIFFMTIQHHEGGDGAGYPLGLPEQAIHPWARLLKLLDTYEAMTSIRPWRAPLSSPKALKVLQHGAGASSGTPALLADFAEFWGGGELEGC
jgi:putative nucleotidyltransferase with HDIG domain